ncbi:SpoIIE family protein phosphatase [Streptomyces sp. NPDC015242]|uniref:SpoIIE family protein phosphatase n=1 Tax=Streptomyces sp. NPDC015242 TaxID=3364951 RepID=UPI0036FD60B1
MGDRPCTGDLADQLVTCLYLVIDQAAHRVTLCSAGPLPLIVLPPAGHARRLRAPAGVPLGVNDSSGVRLRFEEAPHPLPPAAPSPCTPTDWWNGPAPTSTPGSTTWRASSTVNWPAPAPARRPWTGPRPGWSGRSPPDAASHDDDVTPHLLGVPHAAG